MSDMVRQRIVVDDPVIDADDYMSVLDPVWWSVNILHGAEAYAESARPFTSDQWHMFAVVWYSSEVNNGGIYQGLTNSAGIVWQESQAGFRKVGAKPIADSITEIAVRMGGHVPLDRDVRESYLDTHPEISFEDLDDVFYDFDETHSVDFLINKYISENRKSFYFDGIVLRPSNYPLSASLLDALRRRNA